MKKFSFKDMIRGWFVGDFEPTAFKTKDFEVAVQEYKKGDTSRHVHKVAAELSFMYKGKALINNVECKAGDIILLEPGEPTDFLALEDITFVVVKVPSVKGDKYPID